MASWEPFQEEQHRGHGDRALPSVYGGTVVLRRRRGLAAPELSSSSGRSAAEEKALRVHSEAERRRRERINAHLDTLRTMIPEAKQMDKATLLARVVHQVKHLKKKVSEATDTAAPIPPEADEVTVQCYAAAASTYYVRASIICEDRPGLLADIAGALRGLGLRALSADTTSIGGRAQHVLVMRGEEEGAVVCLKSMKETVKRALASVAFPEKVYAGSSRSKRQRILEPHYSMVAKYSIR